MIRLLLFLLGTVTVGGSGRGPRAAAALRPAGYRPGRTDPEPGAGRRTGRPGGNDPDAPDPAGQDPAGQDRDPDRAADSGRGTGRPGRAGAPGGRRRRVPRWLKVACAVAVAGWVFRRAVTFLTLTALGTALHVVGISAHLPKVSFGWPWQGVSAGGTTTNTDLGPWVLQKIEGISKPALGQANFDFVFTHKVSKNIGPLPCWYASTFYAVGHAAATVDLNPGPSWWAPGTGHYRLQVLSQPAAGRAGRVAVTMVLPRPQLPQSVHDVTIDNLPSRPVSTQHSWTYPGIACGMVLRPQFPQSVLYAQAQRIAFYRADHTASITRPLISTAQAQAAATIRDSFIQPAVNALGYTLEKFTIAWTATQPG
jgi:hypothetical protein